MLLKNNSNREKQRHKAIRGSLRKIIPSKIIPSKIPSKVISRKIIPSKVIPRKITTRPPGLVFRHIPLMGKVLRN